MAVDAPLAVITGASSGIGRATAERFARRGWRTVLLARRREPLEQLAAELSARAPSSALPLDLADEAATARSLVELIERFGPPDALVNNAGTNDLAPFLDTAPEDHARIFRVNYHAPAQLIHALLPAMAARGGSQPQAHVINVCSIAAKHGPWGHSSYAAAKAALVSLTQTLAAEHRGGRVRFSCVNPGIVRTPYFERPSYRGLWEKQKRRAIEPERVADAIVGLIDRPRLEVCVPGHYRLIDWISAISPALAHAIVARSSRV